jgi:hypothetical protein
MKLVTEKECLSWLERFGMQTSQYSDAADLISELPFPNLASIRYTLPEDSGKKVCLARTLFWQAKLESTVLVWLRNWMVWPSCAHMPLVLKLRQAMGGVQPLEDAPGHLFEQSETDDAVSLLIVCLVSYWDCFIFDSSRRLICFVSHDNYMILMSVDQAFLHQLGDVLETAKWCRRLPEKVTFVVRDG